MKAGWKSWRNAFAVAWSNLTSLVILNLLWLVVAWPVVTVGPALLAVYWWAAHVFRDEQTVPYQTFFRMCLRFFWRGLLWSLGWAVVLLLAYTNMVVWGHLLAPFAAWVVRMLWVYAFIFLLAMQPYLLELLTVDELGWGEALKRSAWQVAANPLYSHMHVLIIVLAAFVAYKTTTLLFIFLVALVLVWWAVIAADAPWKYGEARPVERNIEDVL